MSRFKKLMCGVTFLVLAQWAYGLEILTEENPPLNFTRAGQMTGTSTQVLREMLRRADVNAPLTVLPWNEAYTRTLNEKEICLYSTVRNDAREKLFQWVGPISSGAYSAFALKDFAYKISRVDDLKQYRVGVARDARVDYLRQRGFSNLVEADDDRTHVTRLTLDQDQPDGVDIWITQDFMAPMIAKDSNVNIKRVFNAIMTQYYWLACNPGLPQPLIKKLDKALSSMRRDNTYNALSNPSDLLKVTPEK